jgi:putative addiction module antidote
MAKTVVRRIGNSYGVILPKTVVERMNLSEGEELHVVEDPKGIYLSPYDPEFEIWAEAFENLNRQYKNTLKALAR